MIIRDIFNCRNWVISKLISDVARYGTVLKNRP